MKITYDKSVDAVYIYLVDRIKRGEATDTQGDYPIHVDLNENHEILGIEVLEAKSIFNEKLLTECEQL